LATCGTASQLLPSSIKAAKWDWDLGKAFAPSGV
jgi:hypothetical protein